jgi:integrase
MNIDFICNSLLEALAEAGYHGQTVFNYEGVIRRFKAFCGERGVTDYTPVYGQKYADDVISRKTGKFSNNRYYSQGRFVRLLNTYYITGAFDFATQRRVRVEPESDKHKKIYHDYGIYLRSIYPNENTALFYEYELYCLLQYLNTIQIYETEKVSRDVIIGYLKTTKQCRQRAVLCGLRLFFTYAGRKDLYASIEGIRAYRSKKIIPVLTDEEQLKIRDTIETGETTHRDAAIVLLGLSTGIRACDLINLRLSDIDWIGETFSFQQKKTGNPVCLPLTVPVGNAIARYLTEERPKADNDYLFVRTLAPFNPLSGHASCYAVVERVFTRAGISKDNRIFGMHLLRHNVASAMVKNEVPIATVAAVLGHADTDTADVYITTDVTRLKECTLPMTGISMEVNA